MKYIVAVSGGVDSMVLLDMMVAAGETSLVVAHFDHGIRSDSALDAQHVEAAAKRYGLTFETEREELGKTASEAYARGRRYAFLRQLAKKYNAQIVTAHHLDDLVETIAINATRGTGWRGVAALDSDVIRPLVDIEKATLIAYARRRGLEWREDSTNASDEYLRNRLRKKTSTISTDVKRQLRALHEHQKALKKDINNEVRALLGSGPSYSRYFFTHVPVSVAIECLRELTSGTLTRPQLARALHAVKVALPNTTFQAGATVSLYFTTRHFSLQLIKL